MKRENIARYLALPVLDRIALKIIGQMKRRYRTIASAYFMFAGFY